jgi:Zn-dependent protease with chaperone function
MHLVYFLLLPSALLSVPLADACAKQSQASGSTIHVAEIFLSTWLVVGCFVLAASWLERSRGLFGSTLARVAPWWLRYRFPLLLWCWCFSQPVCLAASGWAIWVRNAVSTEASLAGHYALLLTPTASLLVLIEIVLRSGAHRYVREPFLKRSILAAQSGLRSSLHSWLIPLALPLLMAATFDISHCLSSQIPHSGIWGQCVCAMAATAATTLLIPHGFAWLIGAQPTDKTIEESVLKTWRISNCKAPQILQWPTGCRVANAAVVGVISYGRKLLLTDALLQKLNDRELTMVVLHELAHCVRYHAWIRMLPTIVTVVLMMVAVSTVSGVWLSASCLLLLSGFLACLTGVCWWTEFDADRVAIQLAIKLSGAPQERTTVVGANTSAHDLVQALRKIYGAKNIRRSTWLHPSCERRVEAIYSRMVTCPTIGC